jgi:hypothetical protein
VIDGQTQALLQEVLRREGRSELMYVAEAYPWAAARGHAARDALQALIREEADALTALGRWMTRRRVALPYLGAFPTAFTTLNFLALDYLLPRLRDLQREAVARLERDAQAVTDPEARAQLESLLALKRRHLVALESLASTGAPPAAEPAASEPAVSH